MATTSPTVSCLLAALVSAGGLALSAPAHAQLSPQNSMAGMRRLGTNQGQQQQQQPQQPAAPALPGSHAAEPVAPATKPALDMAPNEALFDAINRGDIAAARDAVNRGADLNGKNVLGETPLELSIDLGRNDISFLLLSMRRVIGVDHVEPAALGPEPLPATRRDRRRDRRVRAAELQTTAAAAPAPLAGISGGTPVPSAGFLGFDFGHQTAR